MDILLILAFTIFVITRVKPSSRGGASTPEARDESLRMQWNNQFLNRDDDE